MALEQLRQIDLVTVPAPGKLGLHIVDTGTIYDPESRYLRLMAKLHAYVRYVQSAQFADEYPGYTPEEVVIFVEHFTPLTPSMARVNRISPHGEEYPELPVVYIDHSRGI